MFPRFYRLFISAKTNFRNLPVQEDFLRNYALRQTTCLSTRSAHTSLKVKDPNLNQDVDTTVTKDTMKKVNEHIKSGSEGRLFAVVHLCGKQFKITPEDIIIVEGYWPPTNEDEIKLEKVLLVGGQNFTLIGRPVLPQDLVSVKATVIEKDLSHTKTLFYKRRRKQYMRINFYRSELTMLRIKEVSVNGRINEHKTTYQVERI